MKYKVTLNNRVYEVEVEEGEAMLVDEYELKTPVAAENANLTYPSAPLASYPKAADTGIVPGTQLLSPMPGNILKINASVGQKVSEGEVVVVLEAMKMENEIAAPKSGTVAQILVGKGEVVETGKVLLVIA